MTDPLYFRWRAIGKDGHILTEVRGRDNVEADDAIVDYINASPDKARLKASWHSTKYKCEYWDGHKWVSE